MSLNSVDFWLVASIDCQVKLFQPFSSTLEESEFLHRLFLRDSAFLVTYYLGRECIAFSSQCWETAQGQKHTLKQQPCYPAASPRPFFEKQSKMRSCFDAVELVLMELQLSWEVVPVFSGQRETPSHSITCGLFKTNRPAAAAGEGVDFWKGDEFWRNARDNLLGMFFCAHGGLQNDCLMWCFPQKLTICHLSPAQRGVLL